MAAAQNVGQDGGIKTPTAAGAAQTPRFSGGPPRYDTIRDKERKIGHRRIDEGGVVTYKKVGGGLPEYSKHSNSFVLKKKLITSEIMGMNR